MLRPATTAIPSAGAAVRRTFTTSAMPYHRLRSTCPRGTRIATIRAAAASASTKTTTTTTAAPAMTMTHAQPRRLFHHSRTVLGSTKEDHMQRDRLNPTSTEYSKTGSDDAAAHMDDAAFNPNKTSPEEEVNTAEQESGEVRQQPQSRSSQGSNPLDVSPGNAEVSKGKDPQQGGPDRSPSESGDAPSSRARSSGHGSPRKHGTGKTGGGAVPGTQ